MPISFSPNLENFEISNPISGHAFTTNCILLKCNYYRIAIHLMLIVRMPPYYQKYLSTCNETTLFFLLMQKELKYREFLMMSMHSTRTQKDKNG